MDQPTRKTQPMSDQELDQLYHDIISDENDPANDSKVLRARDALALIAQVKELSKKDTVKTQLDETHEPELEQFLSNKSFSLPSQIGRFQINRLIGQGGFGMVLLAMDPVLNRKVALKIPKPECMASPELKSRFLRECRAAASLSHPNIVPVFESDQIGSVCYLATEYIRGITLADWHATEDVAPRTAAKITATIAEAIGHAHQRGILHRDIKPTNIMVSDAEAETSIQSRIQVTDFGLAKNIHENADQTHTGALVGTPAYMSPEQAKQETASQQSDIYSIGTVLYYLLTGQPPHSGSGLIATISSVINDTPTAPTKIKPKISADLEAICLKCLEKDPEQRYASAFELGKDLNAFLTGEPILARRPNTLEKMRRWLKQNRGFAIVAASLFLILASATAISSYFAIESNRDKTAALKANENAESNAQLAMLQTKRITQAVEQLFTSIAGSPEIQKAEMAPLRRKLYESSNKFLNELVDERTDLSPEMALEYFNSLLWGARVDQQLGYYQEGLHLVEQAEPLLEQIAPQARAPLTLYWKSTLNSLLNSKGDFSNSQQTTKSVLKFCEQMYATHPGDEFHFSVLLVELWRALPAAYNKGQTELHAEIRARLIQLAIEKYGRDAKQWPDHDHCIYGLHCLMTKTLEDGFREKAIEHGNLAVEMNQRLVKTMNEKSERALLTALLTRGLAEIHSNSGRFNLARENFQLAENELADPSQRLISEARSLLCHNYFDQALVEHRQEDFALAIKIIEKGISECIAFEKDFSQDSIAYLQVRCERLLNSCLHMCKKTEIANEQILMAREHAEALLLKYPNNDELKLDASSLFLAGGEEFRLVENFKDAELWFVESLQLAKKAHASSPSENSNNAYCLALRAQGLLATQTADWDKGIQNLEESISICDDELCRFRTSILLFQRCCTANRMLKANELIESLVARSKRSEQKYQLAITLAQSVEALRAQDETSAVADKFATLGVKILCQLKESNFRMQRKSMEVILKEKAFMALKSHPDFPTASTAKATSPASQ
jgi:serine/threonine protein kinase